MRSIATGIGSPASQIHCTAYIANPQKVFPIGKSLGRKKTAITTVGVRWSRSRWRWWPFDANCTLYQPIITSQLGVAISTCRCHRYLPYPIPLAEIPGKVFVGNDLKCLVVHAHNWNPLRHLKNYDIDTQYHVWGISISRIQVYSFLEKPATTRAASNYCNIDDAEASIAPAANPIQTKSDKLIRWC